MSLFIDIILNRDAYTSEILNFIWFLKKNKITHNILDCGAGGRYPKLGVLAKHGFTDLYGIELEAHSIQTAQQFASKYNYLFEIQQGNMKNLPFSDDTFNAVYSYNTIFHLTKVEIQQAVDEMVRVLRPGGIGFINFMDVDDDIKNYGKEVSPGEFLENMGGEKVLHTVLSQFECEQMLNGVEIFEKHHKFIHRLEGESPYIFGMNDYFFRKI